jgi:hypothetical protein
MKEPLLDGFATVACFAIANAGVLSPLQKTI